MFLVYELIDLLPPTFEPIFAPRLNNLFLFLAENKGMKEKEACEKYLGSTKRIKYFNKMKTQLRSQLSHYLIAWPSTSDNKDKALYEECYKDFTSYKLLLLNGKRAAAIEIAKNLLVKLRKVDFHSLTHLVAHDLLFHYSSIDASPRLAKKYERLAVKELEIVRAESMVRTYHSRVGFICNTRDSFTKSIINELQEAAENTLPLLRLGSSYLNRLIYSIVVSRYAVVYDNENIIKYCNEALASFPKNHPNSRSLRFSFMQNKALALAATGELEEAKITAKEACQIVPVGSFNWHVALMKRIIICFHAGAYQEAYELYKAHKQQKCLHKNIQEYWKILHGYLYFLIEAGKIEAYSEERFNLAKFLNDMPVHSRDKAGSNINILIIQILIRMQRNQFGHIIDRIESLRGYAQMYTHNPETKRANIFINMIVKMETAQFHRSGTELKTKKLLERLHNTPLKIGQNLAIEIIPYSVLWEEVLLMLEDKFRARTVRKTSKI